MSPEKIKLSFVIPVYNSELYLNKCIDSILSSKSPDIEIVLVDDGSTDKSGQICDDYSKKFEFVKTIHKENGGVASSRNRGVKESSGNYIFFIDNDDWIDGKKIENLIKILKDTSTDILINKYTLVNEKGNSAGNAFMNKELINNKSAKDVLNYFRKNRINIMAPWEYVIRKKIITNNNLSFNINQDGTDDSCFSPMLFCNCKSFYLGDDIIYFWRIRPDSQGGTQKKHDYITKMISTIEVLSDYLNKIDEEYKTDYIYFSIHKNVFSLLGQYYNSSKEDKICLDKWYNDNVDLIRESIRRSGIFHRTLTTIFGNFVGIILSYKFAILKGQLYLMIYRPKDLKSSNNR